MIDSKRCLACILIMGFLFFSRYSVSKDRESAQRYGFYEGCGISLSFPKNLDPVVNYQIKPCLDSYVEENGATLSLGIFLRGGQSASTVENLPSLHIYRQNLDVALSRANGSGMRRTAKGVVNSMTNSVGSECGLSQKTSISKIRGANWIGWVAEDFYKKQNDLKPPPEYCERFDVKNRCIRLILGNDKEVITMSQYCLVRRDENFDLDSGLSYRIFMDIIKSIKLIDE